MPREPPSDDDSISSEEVPSSDEDYNLIFLRRTKPEISDRMRFWYDGVSKEDIIVHGITHAYAADALPNLATFLDLFINTLTGAEAIAAGRRITKRCLKSLYGAITRLLSDSGTNGLIKCREDEDGNNAVLVSVALVECVRNGEFKMKLLDKEHHLRAEHRKRGRVSFVIEPDAQALPNSGKAFVDTVMDFLVRREAFTGQRPTLDDLLKPCSGGGGGSRARVNVSNARFSSQIVPLTEADALALEQQKKAWSVFVEFIKKGLAQYRASNPDDLSWPPALLTHWEWNHESFAFDEKNDYAGWAVDSLAAMLDSW
ncbi:Hypothetical predicted protein [Lecanosticta acicola]|uniref:Uncharacterized protein n=1 Tax=Lecanosticta acicola TaxID=111012 RepID=A0AAI9EFQ3_9PEZI|nr:Hypothetical predicted protein [Lecanosticta acicola]